MSGLIFVGTLFKALGVAIVLGGGGVALLGTSPHMKDDRLRHWLTGKWRGISQAKWGDIPRRQAQWLLAGIDGMIKKYFTEADRTAAFNALLIALIFIFIPAASLINLLAGGAPFLFLLFLSCAGALAVLNFTGETGRLFAFNSLLSLYLGFCLFLLAPLYVFHSFTDRILNEVIGHAFLESILVAILCYFSAYCIMRTLHSVFPDRLAQSRWTMAANGFFAALPAAYILTFLALLTGHFAVYEDPQKDWPLLISSMVFTSLSLPLTLGLVSTALVSTAWTSVWRLMLALSAGAVAASALSSALYYFGTTDGADFFSALNVLRGLSPAGDQVRLDAGFWTTRLPFIPVFLFFLAITLGLLAKALLAPLGVNAPDAKPYQLSGLLCACFGAVLWSLGMVIY